jgi:hypothetical protein
LTNVDSAEAPLVLSGGNLALAYQAPFGVAAQAFTSEPARSRLRFWLVPGVEVNSMGVDNSNVIGMDYSSLPPGVTVVIWENGVGNVEYGGTRLRQNFVDVTPYVQFFQQFMALLDGITLTQAQKIQTDLIDVLYDAKRQMPYHYPIAAGDYMWETTDPTVAAMSTATIPTIIGYNTGTSDSTVVGKINALIDQINAWIVNPGNILVDQINAQFGNGNVLINNINTQIVNVANALTIQINVSVVSGVNDTVVAGVNSVVDGVVSTVNVVVSAINAGIVSVGNAFITFFNAMLGGWADGSISGANTINNRLRTVLTADGQVAVPGLSTDLAHSSSVFSTIDGISIGHIGTIGGVTENPISALSPVFAAVPAHPFQTFPHQGVSPDPALASINWTPLGSASTVTLSATEMSGLMSGISQRRASLLNVCTTKKNQVNALTTLAAVIAYDVTSGWPAV